MKNDYVFEAIVPTHSQTLSQLRRRALSLPNRLRSIVDDSRFVVTVADLYGRPLVANERCGSWYIPPELKLESVQFKSTDGHNGSWAFSSRRLNLGLLGIIEKHNGCVVVDSTRRGKRMPDALSKTVPIWCSVVNQALFPQRLDAAELYTPPQVVSRSEQSQIEGRLASFISELMALELDLQALRKTISKPIRPIWVTQDSALPAEIPQYDEFHPVILCTASRRVVGTEVSEGGYIQGAGDDAESWAHGLTPALFWNNKEQLIEGVDEEGAVSIVRTLVHAASDDDHEPPKLVAPTNNIFIGRSDGKLLSMPLHGHYDAILHCSRNPSPMAAHGDLNGVVNYLHLPCGDGKQGSRDLRKQLHQVEEVLRCYNTAPRVLICCPTGKDLSVGVALVILSLYVGDDGAYKSSNARLRCVTAMTKAYIRKRLSWLMVAMPSANPSRATLQSVNSFLFSRCSRDKETSPPL
ncbi:tRNA a64-2'-o-ribosylphosphate transferase [Lineolata rhizophorae]|uniref:tRNA a64-2'-o-ribosylphosphate transferase n=1 Tax=Lineolata rhizophorae TaxID=578093 RepID=A0A6A6NZM3_9PEZI|nr:tRNA a64-2'-o-ribosylphosphate transferase [Lineolata rhizophorae]